MDDWEHAVKAKRRERDRDEGMLFVEVVGGE